MSFCNIKDNIQNMYIEILPIKSKSKKGKASLRANLNISEYLHKTSKLFIRKHVYGYKRTSLCLSNVKIRASMTVEAAFVVPIFLFAVLNMMSAVELYRLQSNLNNAMHQTAKEMAVYAYEYNAAAGEDNGLLASLGITYGYAAEKVVSIIGKAYLSHSVIAQGTEGISWLHSRIMQEEECIDLFAVYQVKPIIGMIGFDTFQMCNRVRMRAWTGYDNTLALAQEDETDVVYITGTGSVYHMTRSCSHLKLSIVAVLQEVLEAFRNEEGGKYYPCEKCGKNCGNTVFVAKSGNRYHATLQCSGLKRTIQQIPLSQVGDRTKCKRCGGE